METNVQLQGLAVSPLEKGPSCTLNRTLCGPHNRSESRFFFFLLLLLWRYKSDRVLAFSTISFHLRRSCTCSAHFISFIFFRSFMTSSSHRDLCLLVGLPVNGFHLCILFTMQVSGIPVVSKQTQTLGFHNKNNESNFTYDADQFE